MKRERAFVESRRNRIVEIMEEKPEVRVDELPQILGVSLITIRRDLQYLECIAAGVDEYCIILCHKVCRIPSDKLAVQLHLVLHILRGHG